MRKVLIKQNLAVLMLLMLMYPLHCQVYYNGTRADSAFIQLLKENLDKESNFEDNQANANLTLTFFYINSKTNIEQVDIKHLNEELIVLNELFQPVNIHFSYSKINNIINYYYDSIYSHDQLEELTNQYYIKNTINVYLHSSIYLNNLHIYGLTSFPENTKKDVIHLRKDYLNANTLAEQTGHLFGLLSTHETIAGKEFVDQTNCDISGDLICDTYADPGLKGKVDTTCHYTRQDIDPKGIYYVPTVANIMSSGLPECECVFTPGQYRRILFYYFHYKNYLR